MGEIRNLKGWEYLLTFGYDLDIYAKGDSRVGIGRKTGEVVIGDVYRKGEKFTVSGDNKGLMRPFKSIICQEEGSCKACQIYLDWQKLGEILVICAWCGKEIDRKPALGHQGVSHGICPECKEKHFLGGP